MPISTSSLLASAAARRNKIQQQQDDLIAFEYSLSAKTYDDFVAYSNYLKQQSEKNPDASSQLTYQKAIVGARKGYTSNEIQRQNIDVIEGRADNRGKYQKMVDLYYQALNNNDYDLAQSLNLQLDNLSVKIQLEDQSKAEAAQRVAGAMASNQVKDLKALVKKIKEGTEEIDLGNGQKVAGIKQINETLRTGDAANYFAALYDTTKALQSLVGDAYNSATDQDTVDKIANDTTLHDIITGDAKFGVAIGSNGQEKKLGMEDIELAYRSAAANNPIYSLSTKLDAKTGQQTFSLKENKIDDFAWTRNDDGTFSATEVRSSNKPNYQSLSTEITDDGHIVGEGGYINTGEQNKDGTFKGTKVKSDKSLSIGNRLQALGVVVEKPNSDGTFDLLIPGQNATVKGSIMPDGTLRYFGAPGQFSGESAGLYEINVINGNSREVAPDEASDFGNESVFGGLLSQPSERGQNYIKNLQGLSPVKEVAPVDLRKANINSIGGRPLLQAPGGIQVAHDFSGSGSAVTTRLLQGANFTSGNVLKEAQERIRQAAAAENARLQAARTVNLNQTPVAQFASNGAPIRQLTVAKPKAQPRISIQQPAAGSTAQLAPYAVPQGNFLQGFR